MKYNKTQIILRLIATGSLGLFIGACGVTEDNAAVFDSKQDKTETISENRTQTPNLPASDGVTRVVTSKGFEGVTFGMTEIEADSAYSIGLKRHDHFEESEKGCYYLYPKNLDFAEEFTFGFMVVNGTIQRIDIGSIEIATDRHAKIGMSFDAIEELYSSTHRQPNFYTFPMEDLIVQLDNDTKAIFEQDTNGIVNNYRVGKSPSIEFVEGCL